MAKQHPAVEVLNQLVSKNTTMFSTDEVHECSFCGRVVEKLELELFPGKKVLVQPVCKCESDAKMKEIKDAEEYDKRREAEKRFSLSKLGKRFEGDTFDNFIQRQGSEKAYEEAKGFAERFTKETDLGLYLFGNPGNGKTKLAGSIANALSEKGMFVIYEKTTKLLDRIKDTFERDSKANKTDIMRDLRMCDLLILDDIAVDKSTEWVEQTLYEIIDMRYEDKKPIVFTSNVPASKLVDVLGKVSEVMINNRMRIQDRIFEMCAFVKNNATSYRKELADKRTLGE